MTEVAPTSEETKEVYARFGLAYYMGEVLHRGLCNLFVLTRFPDIGGITRPRVEELLSEAYSTTLGRIINLLALDLPEDLTQRLRSGVEHRNFLAHHFWFERIHLMPTSEGMASLVRELALYTDEFEALDGEVEKCAAKYRSRLPVSDELMARAYAEVLAGKPNYPLIDQRPLKKRETIVAVYEASTTLGKTALIFEADDGTLWQLCDAGLGWTAYEGISEDWKPAERFNGLLPARINPRPDAARPWNFEIPFGKQATLVVLPGTEPNSFGWKLRRPKPVRTDQ